jgi:hypothetical protein
MPIVEVVSLRSESSRGTGRGLTSDGNGGETPLDRSELRESAAPTGVLVTDAQERVLHAEGAAFPQHGLSVAGWKGRRVQELLPAVAVGVRAYLQDVASLYEELTFTPLELRQTPDSVIGFGHVEAHGANPMSASVLWIVQLQEGELSSIEVFQAPEPEPADQTAPRGSVGARRT